MNFNELKTIITRLASGPVPTQEKKVYIFIGPVKELKKSLSGKAVIESSALDAFEGCDLPEQEESLRSFIEQRLSAHIEKLRGNRETSAIVLRDAVILARYRVPLTFLYNLVGDAHAVVLHCNRSENIKGWKPPSYVYFNPAETTAFFDETLGNQCIYI